MNKTNKSLLLLLLAQATLGFLSVHALPVDPLRPITDFDWIISGGFKPEMFYGKNLSLLNNSVTSDKIWYMRYTMDLNFDLAYGRKTFEDDIAKFYCNLRSKAIWGNSSVVPTTEAVVKILNVPGGFHKHFLPRLFFWVRECWIRIDLCPLFNLNIENDHSLTLGAFPFELGRGIALGDAYATGPDALGFYTDSNVDQFAFGGKVSGELLPKNLNYDFYTAILSNRSSGLGETAEFINGQIYGKLNNPERGFGVINFVTAGRLIWNVFDNTRFGKWKLEPYGLYNSDPEQRVEAFADASSKLGTVGLASEYRGDRFELGFDWAQNFGRQLVKGLDRNVIIHDNRNGLLAEVNSSVFVGSPTGPAALFVPNNKVNNNANSQVLIDAVRSNELLGVPMSTYNGMSLGVSNNQGELFNGPLRFRDAYKNIYKGWMFVTDASLWIYKKDLSVAVTAGVASGDENPNFDLIDGDYQGFIGLQEIYSGKRVKSAFVLGGAGKLKRPTSMPNLNATVVPNRFANSVSGFHNLVFTGVALNWKPENVERAINVNPNFLAYWQQFPTHAFDIATGRDSNQLARTYLGSEANLFFYIYPIRDFKVYFVGSAFFPGSHYEDIKGKPLNPFQLALLNRLDRTGIFPDILPNIGVNIAYTFNLGIEFKF